ncbi:hypothetical protein [Pseudodesulfovibrio senegalensis]|uniref:Uncharacterized protein n=1 Tax=Pseudodesulfovibrio senegalensis TaxID=1721087 RepID=A0A6N6N738_9BACT|nr:hypothetical protein [Pseudodesulfovibrio senegalensis]KAB1443826.1 hypothetical protein F8A88_06225 [Pseudodesulfovibrio senegalensis]
MKRETIIAAAMLVALSLLTAANFTYFARAYFLHLIPMLWVVWLVYRGVANDGLLTVRRLVTCLLVAGGAGAFLELYFKVYKRTPFDENGIITLFSVMILFAIGLYSFSIYQNRRGQRGFSLSDRCNIWLIMGVGFVFLAVDDFACLHEGLDKDIHKMLGIRPTAFTTHLDDLLIGLYGVIGIVVLRYFWREIASFRRFIRFLIVGFVFLFMSVLFDLASNGPEFFNWLLSGGPHVHEAYMIIGKMEELSKIVSEIFFLGGFYTVLQEIE